MRLTFTRTDERSYVTRVVRDDGLTIEVPGSDRMLTMPHDLAHFVVEQELGLTHGFWGCVAAGAVFPGMKVIAGRQRPHAAERSRAVIREAGQRGTEAEVLVGTLLRIMEQDLDNDVSRAVALLADEWQPSKSARDPLATDEVRRVCRALRDAREQWRALPVGGGISVTWRPTARRKRGVQRERVKDSQR